MAALDKNRLLALFWLAVTFWVHVFARLRARISGSAQLELEKFRDNYRPDGIWLLDAADRGALPGLGECVACRLCDPVCPSMHAEHGRGFVGPSRLVMSNHRLLPAVSTWLDPFLCIRCRACDDACPQGVEIDRMIGSMRRAVAREARAVAPVELRTAVDCVAARGHLGGEPPGAPRRDGALATSDYVYVASCAASQADVQAETALLARAGIDFATAPPRCCGGFGARALGEPAAGLPEALARDRALHVATSDPRCLEHMRRNPDYRELVVRHVLELAADVRAAPRPGEPPLRVTYHDPCQFVRVPGGMTIPREAIRRAGGDLVEMRDHGRAAPCCGMGGGTFTFNPELAEELGRARIRAAVATGTGVLLTQSSLCRDHLARCAAKEGAKLEVRNVTELLASRSGALAAEAPVPPAAAPAATPDGQAASPPAGPEPGPRKDVAEEAAS